MYKLCYKHTKEIKGRKKNIIMLTVDLKGAYDKVKTKILINKMKKVEIPKEVINWINNIQTNKKIILKTKKETIIKTTSNNLMQGDTLSRILFNIYTHDINNEEENTHTIQYADDFIIITADKNINILQIKTNSVIQKFKRKLKELKMEINTEKTNYIYMKNKKKIKK